MLKSLYYISKKFSLYVQEVLSHFIFILIQYKSKIVKISYLSRYYLSKKSYPILSFYLYNTPLVTICPRSLVPFCLYTYTIQVKNCEDINMFLSSWPSPSKCTYVIYLYFMSKKSLLYVHEVFTMYPRSLYYISKKSLAKNLYYIYK